MHNLRRQTDRIKLSQIETLNFLMSRKRLSKTFDDSKTGNGQVQGIPGSQQKFQVLLLPTFFYWTWDTVSTS